MTRIFYLCPSNPEPIGGIKVIYEHVDLLNQNGFQAYVLHKKPGFRCQWFPNKTPIVYPDYGLSYYLKLDFLREPPQLKNIFFDLGSCLITDQEKIPPLSNQDILVIPDYVAYRLFPQYSDFPYVIFNQGAYITFKGNELPKSAFSATPAKKNYSPYHAPHLLGTIVVSEDTRRYLKFAFPSLTLHRVHLSINTRLFDFNTDKKKWIAYMPRRSEDHIQQVISILIERGKLKNWTFSPISDASQEQVSLIMKDSAIFLSFSEQEGFGLPPAEAMSCGCLVVGYHGEGGREFVNEARAWPIPSGDIIQFAQTVEKIAEEWDRNPKALVSKARSASAFIQNTYNRERETTDLLDAWHAILQSHQSKNFPTR